MSNHLDENNTVVLTGLPWTMIIESKGSVVFRSHNPFRQSHRVGKSSILEYIDMLKENVEKLEEVYARLD